jgi:hypothetical protein
MAKKKMKLSDFFKQVCTDAKHIAEFRRNPKRYLRKLSRKHQEVLNSKDPRKIRAALIEEEPFGVGSHWIVCVYHMNGGN